MALSSSPTRHGSQAAEFRVPHSPTALLFWRAVYCALLFLWVANRARVDYILERTWEATRVTWWFKHDSFEPVIATLSFGSWILMFRIVDLCCPYLHRWRIDPNPVKPVKQGPLEFVLRPGIGYCAAAFYLLPILAFDQLYPRRVLTEHCPSSTELLCSIAASVAVYDFIFYWVHLALHKSPWLLRNVHATHHRQDQLISREVVHHSFVDGAMQVGANVFALKLLGLHPLARAAHNVVVTYLLTESHAGYDMPWMVHNIVPCGILGGPPCHEAHHKYGTVNFHQFFTYMDYWLGYNVRRGVRAKIHK